MSDCEVSPSDLRLVIFGCFRYSLGRMTYMPVFICDMIVRYNHIFRQHDWERFIKEIDACENLGGECDKKTWILLREYSENKLKEQEEAKE